MRIRLTFEKNQEMRYTGHLDLHRTWERTFRRAGLPLAYSQGFHPQPKIQLAAALPLGFTSQGELADVWLEESVPLEKLEEALAKALPPGLNIISIEEANLKEPALQTRVVSAEYIITLLDNSHAIKEKLDELLEADTLPRERRGKPYDLRALIEDIKLMPVDEYDRQRFLVRLAARPGATGRPEELLAAIRIPIQGARIHRTRLYFEEE
jgi:radical SAM-linked protein